MHAELTASTKVQCGIDVLRDGHSIAGWLRGRNTGLLTNHTGRAADGAPAQQVLREVGARAMALFSPEHGALGQQEGDVASGRTIEGLPIHSLYGATRRPTDEMLAGLEIVVCDIQDVGARFYTYATTLAYLLEECVPRGIAVVVLDRPNPLGDCVQGPLLEEEQRSFVGYVRTPVMHGLTLGELARFHATDAGLAAELHVVPVAGWTRDMRWPDTGLPWPAPSPNLPDYQSAAWYPGFCLLEFSGVSVGRGTEAPFQIIGAPWFEPQRVLAAWRELRIEAGADIEAAPLDFVPGRATHCRIACRGLRFEVADGIPHAPVLLGLELLAALHQAHPVDFDPATLEAALPLLGSRAVLELLAAGDVNRAWVQAAREATIFRPKRASSLLYPQ